jgi:hypothetical protein
MKVEQNESRTKWKSNKMEEVPVEQNSSEAKLQLGRRPKRSREVVLTSFEKKLVSVATVGSKTHGARVARFF